MSISYLFLFEIDCFHSQWTRNISIAPGLLGGFELLARCLNCQWPFLSCSRGYKSYHTTVISFSTLQAQMCFVYRVSLGNQRLVSFLSLSVQMKLRGFTHLGKGLRTWYEDVNVKAMLNLD